MSLYVNNNVSFILNHNHSIHQILKNFFFRKFDRILSFDVKIVQNSSIDMIDEDLN